jgi:hypothetical protein
MEGLGAADGDVDEVWREALAVCYNGVVVHCVLWFLSKGHGWFNFYFVKFGSL